MSDETREIVIRIEPVRRGRQTPQARLEHELRDMRRAGFEIELFIRGTWRHGTRGGRKRDVVLTDQVLDIWRWDGHELHVPDLFGSWVPATGHRPPPELVIRGVRRRVG